MVCGSAPHLARSQEADRVSCPKVHTYTRHLSGREYLRFSGELLGLERSGFADRISGVLDQVGMSGRADRTMGTYSKGMLQRVALGQALLGEPDS